MLPLSPHPPPQKKKTKQKHKKDVIWGSLFPCAYPSLQGSDCKYNNLWDIIKGGGKKQKPSTCS